MKTKTKMETKNIRQYSTKAWWRSFAYSRIELCVELKLNKK